MKKRAYLFMIGLLAIVLLVSCSKSKDDSDPDPVGPGTQVAIPAIDNAVTAFMTTYQIPGVSIAITKNGKLVYLKSYGKMSATDNTPVTDNSLYRIASVSKPITAVGIMKLLEANKLTLDS
ncbi:MAG: beta-lactamase family protein, partial [Chitinophagaceae bacterium]|nr:beta-lactamase family protein [Chitinophagaceae bacterium]